MFPNYLLVARLNVAEGRNQGGVGSRGQFDVGGLFGVGCLSRCLHAGALHSSHSQGFVPGMENDQLEGGKGLHAICAKRQLPEFIGGTC